QLDQGERVTARPRDQASAHTIRYRASDNVGEQRVRRLEPETAQLETNQLVPFERPRQRITRRQQEKDRIRVEATADEQQRLERVGVEPMSVVDDQEQRFLRCRGGDQAQRRGGDGEAVRRNRRR